MASNKDSPAAGGDGYGGLLERLARYAAEQAQPVPRDLAVKVGTARVGMCTGRGVSVAFLRALLNGWSRVFGPGVAASLSSGQLVHGHDTSYGPDQWLEFDPERHR